MTVDSDTHLDECDETWSYFSKENRQHSPRSIEFAPGVAPEWLDNLSHSSHTRFWFVDGLIIPHRYRSDAQTGTTVATRELHDVAARVSDMDALGVDLQVLYPSFFLSEPSLRPQIAPLLCHSYNEWLAAKCAESKGRLQWVAMIPYVSMPDALEEMRWAKEHGACGVYKRAVEAGHLSAVDPSFFPAYELAAELDLPMCIHIGAEYRPVNHHMTPFQIPEGFEGLSAFFHLTQHGITSKFPGLRFGFIEIGSDWLPHLLRITGGKKGLAELNYWVTCEVGEDLAYLIANVGDDNLLIGTDYGHADRSSVKNAHQLLENRTDISSESVQKITDTNARKFYAFSK